MALKFSMFLSTEGLAVSSKTDLLNYFNQIAYIHVLDKCLPINAYQIGYGVDIAVGGLPFWGIDEEHQYLFFEAGLCLCNLLREAPPFSFALIGIEVDESTTIQEFIEDLPKSMSYLDGTIFREELYSKSVALYGKGVMEDPSYFREKYLWYPFVLPRLCY